MNQGLHLMEMELNVDLNNDYSELNKHGFWREKSEVCKAKHFIQAGTYESFLFLINCVASGLWNE